MQYTAQAAPIWDQWQVGISNAAGDAGFAPFAAMVGGEGTDVYDATSSTAPPALDGGSDWGNTLPKLLLVGLVLWAVLK